MKRRDFLKAVTAAVALPEAFVSLPSFAADTIKVGILHSLSGTMAISETALKETALMTIAEINANGGVMGKMLEPVVVDPASNWPLFAEKARELITKNKVAVVFGCWTSVSRKSVLPVFEELNGLLFYPVTALFGLEQPMAVAQGLASGLAEMFLPAMLLKDADVLVKFVTAIVSVSSVLFLSASIPCVLATRIPLSLGHLLLIWLQRTLLSLVLSIPLAYLAQSLGWL